MINIELIKKHAPFLKSWLEAHNELTDIVPTDDIAFMKYLRDYKRSEYVQIVRRELALEPIEEITAYITAVAHTTLKLSLAHALKRTAQRYNLSDYPEAIAIVGLGKLGGGELNFSSDIDIIAVYSGTPDTQLTPNLTTHEFYCEVTKRVCELIATITADGLVFRVDMRLRPDGDQGSLALSADAYAFYYESYGETWERMMLLKAGYAAGDIEVYNQFISYIKPFVFRRTLDQSAVDSMFTILKKAQLRARTHYKGAKNVKLGEGGLREIEFFVQILQILNYPKYKVSHAGTLDSLKFLAESDIIAAPEAEFLEGAYRFYRNLEHKAQMEWEAQTYTVPETSPTYNLFLERCGYTDEELQRLYTHYSQGVSAIFEGLAGKEPLPIEEIIFSDLFDDTEMENTLRQMGATEPDKCTRILYHTLYSKTSLTRGANDIKMLKVILGQVIEKSIKLPELSKILSCYQRLLNSRGTLSMLYSKLSGTLDNLSHIFATSNYLTEIILSNSKVLDQIYSSSTFDEEEFNRRIETIPTDDPEEEFNSIRILHKDALFRIGYPFLNRAMDLPSIMSALTTIARTTTSVAFRRVFERLAEKYDNPPADYVVVAMGKLGSGEMSFASDLDLVVLYQSGSSELYHRLVQRTNLYLSTITSAGYLYQMDMNLRPSGSGGALVTTLDSFEQYQHSTAMIWEKQALLKAKAICGDPILIERFEKIRLDVLNSVDRSTLTKEIYSMMKRVDREKGTNVRDIKFSPGGFTDIEFAVQMLCLRNQISERNCYNALQILRERGLITSRNYDVFERSYIFYRTLENILRVYENRATTKLPTDPALLAHAAAALGYSTADQLMAEYNSQRRVTRAAFERVFNENSTHP
ncbi:MAG: DUF294 nucleotidyltransferase-like domain-containing protein [Deferribacteraceae bacterium]|jgi:glutamate-ammonia-ligase adenylyltransferase|nr:DUF294 nucleotidyltransferase-like domain-containing protein [Deferribacteraceae bacterium]